MNHLREAKRQAELYTETMLDETTMEHDNAITHALIAIAEGALRVAEQLERTNDRLDSITGDGVLFIREGK